MVTASLVKDLREKTGAGMMDCKKSINRNRWRYGKKQLNYYVKEELQKQLKNRQNSSRRNSRSIYFRRWKSRSGGRSKCRNRLCCKNEEFKTLL